MFAGAQDTGTVTNTGEDQVLKNRKGYDILPKAGDIGLGFNTIPILDLLLGAINPATPFAGSGNVVNYTSNSNNQIVGKYYLDNKTTIRVRFGVNTLGGSITNQVQDAEAMYKASLGTQDDINAASLIKVDDKLTFVKNNVMLSLGFEKRRGYRRLQGFYGAEIGFGKQGSSEKVSYGNNFSDVYPVEFTDNFNSFSTSTQNPLNTRIERTTKTKNTGGFRVGLRGFIGIEYFIFSKFPFPQNTVGATLSLQEENQLQKEKFITMAKMGLLYLLKRLT